MPKILQSLKLFSCQVKGWIRRASSKNIDSSAYIAPGVQILGLEQIRIGPNCTIGENTLFTINTRKSNNVSLNIGPNVYIGRNNFFTVGKQIDVGAYCVFGNNCSFLGSDHVFSDPLKAYFSTGATDDKVIKVGVNCWLGFNVSIVGNVTVGHGSIIGANSVVIKDVPPFSIAVGNPARVIKRYNFSTGRWETADQADIHRYADEENYLEELKRNSGDLPIAYHSSSQTFGDI